MVGTTKTITNPSDHADAIMNTSNIVWTDANPITFAFTTSTSEYKPAGALYPTSGGVSPLNTFVAATSLTQNFVRMIMDKAYGTTANDMFSVEGFTNANISEKTSALDTATIKIAGADTSATAPGGYAYAPSFAGYSGDAWINLPNLNTSAGLGTVMHEIGHTLGLKHSGADSPNLPAIMDDSRYTVMKSNSDTDHWGAIDILALQYAYGANYTTNSGNTTYSWSPTSDDVSVNGVSANTNNGSLNGWIQTVVWDGGGTDTYDLSAFSTGVTVNITPGGESMLGTPAYFGGYHIMSSYLFNANSASLIENVIGGSGNDNITGNQTANNLKGGLGNDTIHGNMAADTLLGGDGNDFLYGDNGNDTLTGGAGFDTFYIALGADVITDFQDGTDGIGLIGFGWTSITQVLMHSANYSGGVTITGSDGRDVDLTGMTKANLDASDFVLMS